MPTTRRLGSILGHFNQGSSREHLIRVQEEQGREIAELRPISPADLVDDQLVALLCDWRRKFMSMFMTQFTPDQERTRKWLEWLIGRDDRLLFIIRDVRGLPLGQYGVHWDSSDGTMELDNGILGVSTGPPRLFYHTQCAVLDWGFRSLGVARALARVFSHNVFAIKLHKTCGLRQVCRAPLALTVAPSGDRHYHPVALGTKTEVPFELVHLEMDRETYLATTLMKQRQP